MEVVAETLDHALLTLSRDRFCEICSGTEAEVNGLMRGRLNAFLDPSNVLTSHEDPIPSLWRQLVKAVTLGQETPSYDGSHLETRPDLNIHLMVGHPSLPLVAECKLIDGANGKTATRYCDDGIARFPSGKYGWAAREAFMVAYVRDGSTLLSSLEQLLRVPAAESPPGTYQVLQGPTAITETPLALFRSTHGRNFKYTAGANTGKEPGPIVLWHLWLAVPQPE